MKVFFAPDYREGVPYQGLLADALEDQGVEVTFPHGNRRVLPLWRGVKDWKGDLLHIHWPEWFFRREGDGLDFARKLRYPVDLNLTLRHLPIVLTAHDLRPHNRAGQRLLSNFQRTYHAARAIIVHSAKASEVVRDEYGASAEKLHVIPHGDLSTGMHALPTRANARAALGIPEQERVCLMFGTIEPYKGIEPVVDWWRMNSPPVTLVVVGKPYSVEYGEAVRTRGRGTTAKIRFDLRWQSIEALERWLGAADCVLFNYRAILTSGAACLARSLGLPILIPRRLDTVDLAEPHSRVFRFDEMETDFRGALAGAAGEGRDYESGAEWRAMTAWSRIAEQTAGVYKSVVERML